MLERWRIELAHLAERESKVEPRRRIEEYLDTGTGSAWLKRRDVAHLIQSALLFFDGERYRLSAWVIMPNHVHALVRPECGNTLSNILHSWKSYSANQANKLLGRTGEFWHEDYFDRYIRNAEHYQRAIDYIEHNPFKVGLCPTKHDWEFSSAKRRLINKGGQDARDPRI
jgi:REP element-mobilizing transposase RayT